MSPATSPFASVPDDADNEARGGIERCVLEAGAAVLEPERIERVKVSYCARRVPRSAMAALLDTPPPRAGDLVLARVERVRQHRRLELTSGRRADLHVGDEILVCYGNRYASDQFEAIVPADLGRCDLVAAGGVAASVVQRHGSMKPATVVQPLGLVADRQGRVLNLEHYREPVPAGSVRRPFLLVVVGSAMNAGKTTTAARLVCGLRAAGRRTAAAKLTGTGAGGDRFKLEDAGASPVLDFTDLGFASTYLLDPPAVEGLLLDVAAILGDRGVEVAVLEIADGLLQRETSALLESAVFRQTADALVYAAADAMGALAGVEWLRSRELPVLAVSGLVTRSPLAVRELQRAIALPVLGGAELAIPEVVGPFVTLPSTEHEHRHAVAAR